MSEPERTFIPEVSTPKRPFQERLAFVYTHAEEITRRAEERSASHDVRSFERLAIDVGARFAKRSDLLSRAMREDGQRALTKVERLVGAKVSRASLKEFERTLYKVDLSVDRALLERRMIPHFFDELSAGELADALAEGMAHPRELMRVLMQQTDALEAGEPVPFPSDIARDRRHLDREGEHGERERFDRMFRLQGECYDALKRASPDRAAELDRRRALEDVFSNGEVVGEPVPLFSWNAGSGAPHTVTLRLDGRTVTAVVKFAFSERYTRRGVEAGFGHWREVAGAMHAVGMRVDAPVVVARRFDRYGAATVMERLDGQSCTMINDWFLDESGEVDAQVGRMAIDDFLKFRTDGAPRNIVRTRDGRLVPIDHGSDMPASPRESLSSAALYVQSETGRTVPVALQNEVRAWTASQARLVFRQMLDVFPEDMRGYVEAYNGRVAALLSSFDADEAGVLFPAYGEHDRKDFGKRFFDDFLGLATSVPRRRAAV